VPELREDSYPGWDQLGRRKKKQQESRAVEREPRDAAAVVFGLKFADNIHYIQVYKYRSLRVAKL